MTLCVSLIHHKASGMDKANIESLVRAEEEKITKVFKKTALKYLILW